MWYVKYQIFMLKELNPLKLFSKLLNLKIISKSKFYTIQQEILFHVVQTAWDS